MDGEYAGKNRFMLSVESMKKYCRKSESMELKKDQGQIIDRKKEIENKIAESMQKEICQFENGTNVKVHAVQVTIKHYVTAPHSVVAVDLKLSR